MSPEPRRRYGEHLQRVVDDVRALPDSEQRSVRVHGDGLAFFCDVYDPWAGTYCKLPAGHDGGHSPRRGSET